MSRFILVAGLLLAGDAEGLNAQDPIRTILLTSGKDTVAVETIRRQAGRLEGELMVRSANQRWHYDATLGPDAQVTSFSSELRMASDPSSAPARQTARLAFAGDSVFVSFDGPAPPSQRLLSTAGVIPYLNPSFGLVEQALHRARRMGRGDATVPFFAVAGGQTIRAEVRWLGRDSAEVVLGGQTARMAVSPEGNLRGGWIPAQSLTISVIEGTLGAAMAAATTSYAAPPGAPYRAVDVMIPTPMGHRLAGTLSLPAGARGPVPAVVTISGSGLQDRDAAIPSVLGYRPFREMAGALAARGMAVLRVDDRGFGGSGGNPATATSADFADDARAALAWLRGRPEIDGARLGLIGHSEGGIIAPMIAVTDPALKGLVLLAGPAYTGRRVIEYQNRSAIDLAPGFSRAQRDSILWAAMQSVDSLGKEIPWMGYFLAHDPLVTARKVRTPVLILHGATDRQVTPDQAAALDSAFRAAGNRDVSHQVFPETNHLFLADPDGSPGGYAALSPTTLRPEVLRRIVEWLASRL